VHEIAVARGAATGIEVKETKRELSTNGIVAELLRRPGLGPIIVFCMKVDDTYGLCNEFIRGKAPLVDVKPPPALELDEGLHRALSRRAAFHNAELSEDERLFVEEHIAAGNVDVVYATSTLAAGVNFPLGSAVFSSWKRWNSERRLNEPIGRAEFQNMAGRVGRMGQVASEGLVILCADGGAEVNQTRRLMDLEAQDELGSGITPDDFGTLTLQLFAGKLCSSRTDAFEIIASTLSASREVHRNRAGFKHWESDLNQQIDRLLQAGCLIESRAGVVVTAFGISVARSGLKPETALFFIEGLVRSAVRLTAMLPSTEHPGQEDDLLFVLVHAALASPEFNSRGGKATRQIHWKVSRPNVVTNDYARRLEDILWDQPWVANVSAANGALLVMERAAGRSRSSIERCVPGIRFGSVEALVRDVGPPKMGIFFVSILLQLAFFILSFIFFFSIMFAGLRGMLASTPPNLAMNLVHLTAPLFISLFLPIFIVLGVIPYVFYRRVYEQILSVRNWIDSGPTRVEAEGLIKFIFLSSFLSDVLVKLPKKGGKPSIMMRLLFNARNISRIQEIVDLTVNLKVPGESIHAPLR
jgi:helicase